MSQPTKMKKNAGFTLIELMLSMAFVAVLLLAIAMTIIQMATIYNRGMTLKEVNQSSRDIADDLRRSFAVSQVFAVNDTSDTSDYVTLRSGTLTTGGRLCTGTDTYVWNIAKSIEDNDMPRLAYANGEAVRLVKVSDINKRYCSKNSDGSLANKDIRATDLPEMTDLLDAGDRTLALQEFKVSTTDEAQDILTGQRLYTVTYTIGSGATSAMDLTGPTVRCLAPGLPNANPVYCNVQQFTIVLRVGNTVN